MIVRHLHCIASCSLIALLLTSVSVALGGSGLERDLERASERPLDSSRPASVQAGHPDLQNAHATKSNTILGVKGSHFTLNAKPTFLYGISYYGALGASPGFIRADLADMQRFRFNWIRVWATWNAFGSNISAVSANGEARQPFLDHLKWLVSECDRRGMIIDVTLSRGVGHPGSPGIDNLKSHLRAVTTLITALRPLRNWYMDLGNECNIRDQRYVSFADLRQLRERAKQLDPNLLVTASQGGDIGQDELKQYLLTARVDFICPHRPRNDRSAGETATRSREYLKWMKQIGRVVPIHYQEPFRRGYGSWQPDADDYVTDLRGAQQGGAAGWCFHNGDTRQGPDGRPRRSFDLSRQRLFDQLDDVERKAIRHLESQFKNEAVTQPRLL